MSAGPAIIRPVEGPQPATVVAPGARSGTFPAMIRPVDSQPLGAGQGGAAPVAPPIHPRLRLSEAELLQAYSNPAEPGPVCEPCACGALIVCISDAIAAGYAAHVATPEHQTWRTSGALEVPSFEVRVVDRRWG